MTYVQTMDSIHILLSVDSGYSCDTYLPQPILLMLILCRHLTAVTWVAARSIVPTTILRPLIHLYHCVGCITTKHINSLQKGPKSRVEGLTHKMLHITMCASA